MEAKMLKKGVAGGVEGVLIGFRVADGSYQEGERFCHCDSETRMIKVGKSI